MTLEQLNEAWQALRTASLGRSGLVPVVSVHTARDIEDALARWNAWYADASPLDDAAASIAAADHVARLRQLEAAVRAQGVRPGYVLPPTVTERAERTAQAGATVARSVGGFAAAVAATVLAGVIIERVGRGKRRK